MKIRMYEKRPGDGFYLIPETDYEVRIIARMKNNMYGWVGSKETPSEKEYAFSFQNNVFEQARADIAQAISEELGKKYISYKKEHTQREIIKPKE